MDIKNRKYYFAQIGFLGFEDDFPMALDSTKKVFDGWFSEYPRTKFQKFNIIFKKKKFMSLEKAVEICNLDYLKRLNALYTAELELDRNAFE